MACHIRKNEMVEVIAGDHQGARGKVLRIDLRRDRVVVEGVNVVYRHVRPSRKNPQGGRIEKEAPIHISNVLPVDSKADGGSRVHMELETNDSGKVIGKKRMSTTGTMLGRITKAAAGGS